MDLVNLMRSILRVIYTFHTLTFTVLISLHQLVKPLSGHGRHLYRMAEDKNAAVTCENRIQFNEKYNNRTILSLFIPIK